MSRVALVGGSRVGSAFALLAAQAVVTPQAGYEFERCYGDMLLTRKKPRADPVKKTWYTVDSPEVKRMSKPYDTQ